IKNIYKLTTKKTETIYCADINTERSNNGGEQMEVEEFTVQMIQDAQQKGSSDIHLSPEGCQYSLYYRMDDTLLLKNRLMQEEGERLVSYLKFLSNMDVGERRKPQSGAAQIQTEAGNCMLRF